MSQAREKIVDDFVKLMMGAVGTAQGMQEEAASLMRSRLETTIRKLDLVSREEFDVVAEMAQQARQENEALTKRLEELERGLAKKSPSTVKKVTRKKPSTAKKSSSDIA